MPQQLIGLFLQKRKEMNHHGVKLTAEGVHSLKRCQEQGTLCTLAWKQALWVCFTSSSCICVVSLPYIPGATTEMSSLWVKKKGYHQEDGTEIQK